MTRRLRDGLALAAREVGLVGTLRHPRKGVSRGCAPARPLQGAELMSNLWWRSLARGLAGALLMSFGGGIATGLEPRWVLVW